MDTAPLTLPEFSASLAAIGGFEARPLIAVAVSGGPDSMALMLLADRWARTHGGRAWGLTVDHGLRRESADESRMVGLWLGARAIPHEILPWAGPKPTSGIQEAAREARYRLLTAWCRSRFCLHLLAAHHLEDQIETHLIRRRAGSGVEGLAGMSAVRELRGCRLLRPLLAVRRERLAALLAAEGQPFLRDPSNLNPLFERARLRLSSVFIPGREGARPESIFQDPVFRVSGHASARHPGMTSPGIKSVENLIGEIRACAGERIAREQALDALIARVVALHPAGFGVLDPAVLAAADPDIAARLLSRVVLCLGGSRYPARAARLARLRAALVQERQRARTLGGCRFVPWRGRLLVLRELALADSPIALEPGANLRWDRRFAVLLSPKAAGAFTVGYLGQHAGAAPQGDLGRTLPPLIHAVLPAFWDGEGVAAVPHLGYARPGPRVLPELSFRPAKPLTPPSFTVV
ncbi:MAG TPA: tRNA lysidine(34) synthetase TilS [Stellaceae bacterium]|nr:tRNA lysidine(34) synthetase TilS [Stellaceae bacterium]